MGLNGCQAKGTWQGQVRLAPAMHGPDRAGLVWRDVPVGGAGWVCHWYQQHPALVPWCPKCTPPELPHLPWASLVPDCQHPRPWALVLPTPSSPP